MEIEEFLDQIKPKVISYYYPNWKLNNRYIMDLVSHREKVICNLATMLNSEKLNAIHGPTYYIKSAGYGVNLPIVCFYDAPYNTVVFLCDTNNKIIITVLSRNKFNIPYNLFYKEYSLAEYRAYKESAWNAYLDNEPSWFIENLSGHKWNALYNQHILEENNTYYVARDISEAEWHYMSNLDLPFNGRQFYKKNEKLFTFVSTNYVQICSIMSKVFSC